MPKLSEVSKAHIRAAQQARWAKIKAATPAQAAQSVEVLPAQAEAGALEKYDPNAVAAPTAPASWSQVKYYAGIAAKFAQASLAAQVMAGFTLTELHKNFGRGGDRKSGSNPHDAGLIATWEETCRKQAGVSDDTARRWMAMAAGIKSRWKKLAPQDRIRELMRVPVSDWTTEDAKLVNSAVAKATDGLTQLDFLRELGICKKPQGAGATGRLPECDNTKKKLSLSEEAALRKTQAIADWQANWKGITAYADKFVFLSDDLVTAQIATLEQALRARKEWLKQPASQRDAAAIAELAKIDPKTEEPFRAALEQLAPATPPVPEVVMHTPIQLPDGNVIKVEGFAHEAQP